VLCKRWREVLRSRPSGAGSKPPQAATVKSRGVSVAEKAGLDPVRCVSERRAEANR
jgi:hypothetical protein